jgi:hypothetical protein
VITGYNTDITHNDRVFHVQTEDRGVDNPVIESLVYTGGKIVHRRDKDYGWLLREGYNEKAVQELVDGQHRKVIRDIQGGKLDPGGAPPFGAGIISDRDFDDLVLDFVKEQVEAEGVEMVAEGQPVPRAGDLLALNLLVRTDVRCKPVDRARIVIRARKAGRKRYLILFDGKTGDDGWARAGLEIPVDYAGGTVVVEATCTRGKDRAEWEIQAK